MLPSGSDSLELMTPAELIGPVRRLLGEMERQRAETGRVDAAFAGLQVENQTLKDEIARLKGLPPRPPHKPSGMEKAQSNGARRSAPNGCAYPNSSLQKGPDLSDVVGTTASTHSLSRRPEDEVCRGSLVVRCGLLKQHSQLSYEKLASRSPAPFD